MTRRLSEIDPGPPPLVLIVEDDRDTREMYAESLAYFGLRVSEASDAHEALRKVRDRRPDIIATDIGLPGLDGYSFCALIKGDERTKKIPVIGVTAWAMVSEVQRAKVAGCDSVLTKPCLPKALLAEIQRLLKLTAQKDKK
jgi:two-component system cell cycle response regulator DivK